AWKRQRLSETEIPVPHALTFAPVDFERESLSMGLTAVGFDPADLVSQRVSALMKKGFLRQDGDPGNRRKVKLGLTGAGEQEMARIYDAMISASTELFDAMGDFRPAFHDALIRMAEDLAREEGLTRPP